MINNGWYYCPCGKKLCKAEENAQSKGVFLKCKNCRKVVEIKIGDEPDEPRTAV